MYAIEFETVIKDKYIELQNAEDLINKQVRVIVLVDEEKSYLKNTNCTGEEEMIKIVFSEAENLKIDNEIDINKICNEVNS